MLRKTYAIPLHNKNKKNSFHRDILVTILISNSVYSRLILKKKGVTKWKSPILKNYFIFLDIGFPGIYSYVFFSRTAVRDVIPPKDEWKEEGVEWRHWEAGIRYICLASD